MGQSPATAERMLVGANYYCYRNWAGKWFGPDESINQQQSQGVTRKHHEEWETDFDELVKHYRELGISVLRVSLLCNGWNYGTGCDDTFRPLTDQGSPADDLFCLSNLEAYHDHYRKILTICASHDMRLIPSLLGFDAFRNKGLDEKKFPGDPEPNEPDDRYFGAGGRWLLATEPKERDRFFRLLVKPMLDITVNEFQPSLIWFWEIFSEPVWVTRSTFGRAVVAHSALKRKKEWPTKHLTVPADRLEAFLQQGVDAIHARKYTDSNKAVIKTLPSSVGHVFPRSFAVLIASDFSRFPITPAGPPYMKQLHWYPDGIRNRTLPPYSEVHAIVGEFSGRQGKGDANSASDPQEWSWPDLGGLDAASARDATLFRLALMERRGYPLALVWPDQTHEHNSNTALSHGVEEGIQRFLEKGNPLPRDF